MSDGRGRLVGAWCWLLQPLLIIVELVAVGQVSVPYSLLDNTISDLGAQTCTTVPYPGRDVPVCSPAHALVNASFVVGGLATALGAVLLRPWLPAGRLRTGAIVAWVLQGLGGVGTGLTPLDTYLVAHTVVSTPAILAGPVAVLLTALALVRSGRRAWWGWVVAGTLQTGVALFFLVRLDPDLGGLLERLVLWPISFALAAVGWAALRRTSTRVVRTELAQDPTQF